jgi:hypothetical protein
MPDPASKIDSDLEAAFRGLREAFDAREARDRLAKPEAAPPAPARKFQPSARVVQLPFWPEPVRGTPNSFLRSALFSARLLSASGVMEHIT